MVQLICPFNPKCQTKIISIAQDTPVHKLQTVNQQTKLIIPFLKPRSSITSQGSSAEGDLKFHKVQMWDFDNIGVSRPVNSQEEIVKMINDFDSKIEEFKVVRYLTCGECDRGALGFVGMLIGDKDKKVDELAYFVCLNSCSVAGSGVVSGA